MKKKEWHCYTFYFICQVLFCAACLAGVAQGKKYETLLAMPLQDASLEPVSSASKGAAGATAGATDSAGMSADDASALLLRPKGFDDFVGQEQVQKTLGIMLRAAQKRAEAPPHLLFCGPPGLGKTSLANIVARESGGRLRVTSGPALPRAAEVASVLSSLEAGDVLFVDEMHRLPRTAEEMLYPAMEDFSLDLITGKGPGASVMRLSLPPFCLVGATTRLGDISSPLRDRFGEVFRLQMYSPQQLEQIITASAAKLEVPLAKGAAAQIAARSRGTPRTANRLLMRVRDFWLAQAEKPKKNASISEKISSEFASQALLALGIDERGLSREDHAYLAALAQRAAHTGGAVGLKTLGAALGETPATIEEVHEPFLLSAGLIARTPRGRVLTEHGAAAMGKTNGFNGGLLA